MSEGPEIEMQESDRKPVSDAAPTCYNPHVRHHVQRPGIENSGPEVQFESVLVLFYSTSKEPNRSYLN